MRTTYSALAVTIGGLLAACDSKPVRPADVDASVGNSLKIIGGDGQTIVQHAESDSLLVRAVDPMENALSGVPVAFDAAPGSDFLFSASVETNAEGIAGVAAYLHAAGQVQIIAQAPDIPPVTFTLQVTPSAHAYDGTYDCSFANNPYYESQIDRLTIADGAISLPFAVRQPNAALDESTGTLTINEQVSLDYFAVMTGKLTMEPLNEASGSGSYATNYHGGAPVDPSGSWSCTRR